MTTKMKIIIQTISFKAHFSKSCAYGVFILALFLSATPLKVSAQRLANTFLEKQNDSTSRDVVYLAFTDSIFHTELSGEMAKVNDSILLTMYKNKLIKTVRVRGMNVITVSMQDINSPSIKIDKNHHTLQIAQLELEEFTQIDTIFYEMNPQHFFPKEIGGIRFSSWLIYDQQDTASTLTFYSDEGIVDYFVGEISRIGNEYQVNYDYKEVNPNDAYQPAFSEGETSAQYFFNFLMNKYVWDNTKDKSKVNTYYSINPQTKDISWSKQPFDNFDIIAPQE